MPDSIQEQIVKKVASALAEITAIQSVQRFSWDGILLGTLPAVLIKEGDCVEEKDHRTTTRIRRRMEVYLVVAHLPDAVDLLNNLVADVEKRLGVSRNWDGLALMTDPAAYLELDLDAVTPHVSRGMKVEIVYEQQRYDPYSQ